jgi:outer membrane receptor protein involved in Fe transport
VRFDHEAVEDVALRQGLIRSGITPHHVFAENVPLLTRNVQDTLDIINLLATHFGKNRSERVAEFRTALTGANRIVDAAYIQDQIPLLPRLKVMAGALFEGFPQRYDETVYGTHNRQDNMAALPRIGVTYQPLQPLTFYASWSRSFSPTLAVQFTPGGQPFQPEYGNQYEIGVRTSELHGRLSSSLAFYRIRASNLLITNPGNPLASIQIGTTESKGIEVETSGRIRSGWGITFAYAYNETRIVADPVYPVRNTFQNAPRHSGSVWAVYRLATALTELC